MKSSGSIQAGYGKGNLKDLVAKAFKAVQAIKANGNAEARSALKKKLESF